MVLTPQLGFNNNVRHKGRVFHIQTEDSGVNHPHITTHLFADGGRILRSVRTDYSELLGNAELPSLLRARMKEQHRAMFVALREGHFDVLIDQLPSESGTRDITARSVQPAAPTPPSESPSAVSPGAARPSSRPGVKRPSQRPRREATRRDEPDVDERSLIKRVRERTATPARGAATLARGVTPAGGTSTPDEGKSSISGATVPRPSLSGGEIYGDSSTISEQSLDDVILSYISQDLDGE